MRLVVFFYLVTLAACASVKCPEVQLGTTPKDAFAHPLVVLTDADSPIYGQVITGIHVAARGNYQIWPLQAGGFTQSALLDRLLDTKPQGVIALGPRSAHAMANAQVVVRAVFSLVPRVENYELNQIFMAAVRMVPDIKEQLSLVRKLLPNVKNLGVVFSRRYSRTTMERLRSLADDEQFNVINIEATSKGDVLPALKRSKEDIGALLMLDDPFLLDVDVFKEMASFLSSQRIALFALDCSMVEAGAMASFGTNFFSLGRDLVRLLENDDVHPYGAIEYKNPSKPDLCLNLKVANSVDHDQQIITRAVELAASTGVMLKIF